MEKIEGCGKQTVDYSAQRFFHPVIRGLLPWSVDRSHFQDVQTRGVRALFLSNEPPIICEDFVQEALKLCELLTARQSSLGLGGDGRYPGRPLRDPKPEFGGDYPGIIRHQTSPTLTDHVSEIPMLVTKHQDRSACSKILEKFGRD